MKNSFYHHQSVMEMLSGNWWPVILMAFVLAALVVGMRQYKIERIQTAQRVTRRYNDGPVLALGLGAALTMTVLLMIESSCGIIQLLDNHLSANDSPMLSLVLTPFVAMTIGGIFGMTVFVIGGAAGELQKRRLVREIRVARAEAQQAAKRRAALEARRRQGDQSCRQGGQGQLRKVRPNSAHRQPTKRPDAGRRPRRRVK